MTVNIKHSSVISQITYSPGVVFVTFRSGAEYFYHVPRKRAFTRFVKARSVGSYFNRVFKKHYGPGELL